MDKIKLIAETAWHHDGDFIFMRKLVDDIINNAKLDILKMHITLNYDEYSHPLRYGFENNKKKLFSPKQWTELINKIKSNNLDLLLLYNDTSAVEFGGNFDPSYVEIHSVCLNDFYLLDALKDNISRKTNIIMGVGGSTLYEIEYAVDRLKHKNIIFMFGFQNYPTRYEDINFGKIQRIMNLYPEFSYGYADHTSWNEPNNVLITLMGAALGMDYIEKHTTNVFGQERVDWNSAISIDMFNEIADKLELLNECRGDGLIKLNDGEKKYSIHGPMKKAGVLKVDVNKGDLLSLDMIKFQRTGKTTDLSQLTIINSIGFEITKNLKAGDILQSKHLKII